MPLSSKNDPLNPAREGRGGPGKPLLAASPESKVEGEGKPIRIHSEIEKTTAANGQTMAVGLKSRTYSFEVVNGYHRFTVIPEDPKDKVFAITATPSMEEAVLKFVDTLYDLAD
ncbi:MAG: hypothetical protein MUF13_14070 [Akkermansiaceae bacterium]|nr:hypothetical protein [Akkermansiaceae bacterium]